MTQIELAKIVGGARSAAAIKVLQARFDAVNKQLPTLWSEEAGYFQNVRANPGEPPRPVDQMAPTNFYPLLVGPENGAGNECFLFYSHFTPKRSIYQDRLGTNIHRKR
jgi:hypothetical protein